MASKSKFVILVTKEIPMYPTCGYFPALAYTDTLPDLAAENLMTEIQYLGHLDANFREVGHFQLLYTRHARMTTAKTSVQLLVTTMGGIKYGGKA